MRPPDHVSSTRGPSPRAINDEAAQARPEVGLHHAQVAGAEAPSWAMPQAGGLRRRPRHVRSQPSSNRSETTTPDHPGTIRISGSTRRISRGYRSGAVPENAGSAAPIGSAVLADIYVVVAE